MTAVKVNNLTKIYRGSRKGKDVTALDDFDLEVVRGSIFGLLGPNGAGKTTLIKILLGITFPTVGNAEILGEDIKNHKIRKRIGYLPENHKFPGYLKGEEVLKEYAKFAGYEAPDLDKRIDELLKLVKMQEWRKTKIRNYSKGMMQRLGLAQALVNDPDLLFLDEPTDGVDPIGRKEIRNILLQLKERNKTIFLNSHLLSEVELMTDRVAILNNGKLIREGTVDEITTSRETYRIKIQPDETSLTEILPPEFEYSMSGKSEIRIKIKDTENLNKAIDFLRSKKILITGIEQQKSSLEDMFINLIQEDEVEK